MQELIRRLCSCDECTVEEILRGLSASRIEARKALAELARKGLVEKKPDYDRRKMVFRAKRELCLGLS